MCQIFCQIDKKMQSTVGYLPLTEELKKKTPIPLGIAVSPTTPGIATLISGTQDKLYRCPVCQGYLSPFCPVQDGKWQCSICSSKYPLEDNEISKAQLTNPNYQVYIQHTQHFGEVYCIYLSTEFNEKDFQRNKLAVMGVLRHLPENAYCLIFLGMEHYPLALLVPPQEWKGFTLTTNDAEDQITADAFSTPNCAIEQIKQEKPVAAFAQFSSYEAFLGLDLFKFFFTKESMPAAERALDKISRGKDKVPHLKSIELAGTIAKAMNGIPVRFISFLDNIPRTPPILEALRPLYVRLDYVITNVTKSINDTAKNLPGELYVLSGENPGGQGCHIAKSKSAYQLVSRCRAHNCATEWKLAPNHLTDIHEQVLYAPVLLSDTQPYAIDIVPLPNQKSTVFQITAKYIINEPNNYTSFIFRVLNFEMKSTDKQEELAKSANWNAVLWFWMHKVYERPAREALSAIMRGAANIIAEIGDISEDFKRGVCSSKHLYALSQDPILHYIGGQLMFTMPPDSLNIISKYVEKDGKKYLLSANGVMEEPTADGFPSEAARELQSQYSIYMPVISPISNNIAQADAEYAVILEKLIKSLKN